MTNMILCARTDQALVVVPGSTQITADCGCEVWISEISRKAIEDPDIDTATTCSDHLPVKEASESFAKHGAAMLPGGIENLRENLSPAAFQFLEGLLGEFKEIDPNSEEE